MLLVLGGWSSLKQLPESKLPQLDIFLQTSCTHHCKNNPECPSGSAAFFNGSFATSCMNTEDQGGNGNSPSLDECSGSALDSRPLWTWNGEVEDGPFWVVPASAVNGWPEVKKRRRNYSGIDMVQREFEFLKYSDFLPIGSVFVRPKIDDVKQV